MTHETKDKQDEEMICGLTVAERDVLQAGLDGLADTMPPPGVWQRIESQARAEGLLKSAGMAGSARWFAGVGLAAAVVLAVIILPNSGQRGDAPAVAGNEVFPTVPEYSENMESANYQSITALMVQSQILERDLRSLPQQPRVRRASTTATIFDLQDRIAGIDYQLNQVGSAMTAEQQEIFWRERVRLMDLLLQLRYAQTQRVAF
jgi:hypothetical protein